MTRRSSIRPWLILSTSLLFFAPNASAVTVDWVTVGNPGNACESQTQGCFGAVSETYRISRTEVTVGQYTEYLNAVAASDPNGVFVIPMGNLISQTGSSGSYSYSAAPSVQNKPIGYATFYHALRFANWMHNGQPTGAQGFATTEDGAYTITPDGIAANSIMRNLGATIFLTSEDEWYKAAFYDALSASYFDYATGTNTPITCAAPGATPNTANCGPALGQSSYVGTYTGSESPYGTFDQTGNVVEWTEAIEGTSRVYRGGHYYDNPLSQDYYSSASRQQTAPDGNLGTGAPWFGFRVAAPIPEPSTALLLSLGLTGLAAKRRRSLRS